jgi:hypothetical protein
MNITVMYTNTYVIEYSLSTNYYTGVYDKGRVLAYPAWFPTIPYEFIFLPYVGLLEIIWLSSSFVAW